MEVLYCTGLILIITIFFAVKQKKQQLPPSPPAIPILGHLHLLKGPQHCALKSLADEYGPIIYLHFGNRPTLVVSSASTAEECFTKNDIVLANRPEFLLSKITSYNNTSFALTPYRKHWRNLRRVTTIHTFSSMSLQHSAAIRAEEIRFHVQKMLSSSNAETWGELNFDFFFSRFGKRCTNENCLWKKMVYLSQCLHGVCLVVYHI